MKLLIFDLDGTLLDTLDDLWASVNHALAQFSLPLRSKCEVRQFLGNGIQALVHRSLAAPHGMCQLPATPGDADMSEGEEEFVSPLLEQRVLEVFRRYYLEHSLDCTRPYPGIGDMLQQCRREGFMTAIVSNKVDAAVRELHRRFFAATIDVAIGEQQPQIRRKPAPDMVFEAMKRLGADKRQSIYVGDSEVDLATARNAGLPCVAVAWGFRGHEFLAESGAETIIQHPSELLPAVSQWLQ